MKPTVAPSWLSHPLWISAFLAGPGRCSSWQSCSEAGDQSSAEGAGDSEDPGDSAREQEAAREHEQGLPYPPKGFGASGFPAEF